MTSICDDDLLDEIRFLEDDLKVFKGRDPAYYKRIALTVRKLVHDTENSTSLLTHLKIKHKLNYLVQGSKRVFYTEQNGQKIINGNSICPLSDPLINQIAGTAFSNLPADYTLPNHILPNSYYGLACKFEQWWDAKSEINCNDELPNTRLYIYYDTKKNYFTRKDLILTAANKDGGAHYDDGINSSELKYVELKKGITSGIIHNGQIIKPLQSTIAEIGYELVNSLKSYYNL
jgi:hypothetical protein